MTVSNQGLSLTIISFVAIILVSLTVNLITSDTVYNTNTAKIPTGRRESRNLSIEARDVGEVPIDVREGMNSNLIDFVVMGFQKCGTTYLQNKILLPSEKVFTPHHETHFLQNDKYSEFVMEFENVTESNGRARSNGQKERLVGYKSPFELGHERSLRNLETLFPDVRMLITLRHPVLQFESLYNYKLRSLSYLIPPVEEYIGVCGELCPSNYNDHYDGDEESAVTTIKVNNTNFDNEHDFRSYLSLEMKNTYLSSSQMKDTSRVAEYNAMKTTKKVTKKEQQCVSETLTFCTGESNYHQYLSRLGLTPMNTPEELDLLDHHTMPIHNFSSKGKGNKNILDGSDDEGKLFLIEIGQFDNRVNQSMADDLISDLEIFMGLDERDLPRIPHRNGDKKPKHVYDYPEGREKHILDICLERYKPLRETLLETSVKASTWIIDYLLRPSNRHRVIVSNIDIFVRMVEEWKVDPCMNEEENLE